MYAVVAPTVPVSMKVPTSTSPLAVGLRVVPSVPLMVTPWAVSGAVAISAVETIGLGVDETGPFEVTLIVVFPTSVDPTVPSSVSVTLTV